MTKEPNIDSDYAVLFEDDSLVIISKSGNIPVHEGGAYKENCLTKILEKKYGKRLYLVYRLDRETSGIVVFAKSGDKVKKIKESISSKEYIALCKGEVKNQVINAPIGEIKGDFIRWKKGVTDKGAKAVTEIISSEKIGDCSTVKMITLTGRQHQIRVHLQHIGNPIIGDKIYGESDKYFLDYIEGKQEKGPINRQALHLGKIRIGNTEILCEMPQDMIKLINELKHL
jgi:23S rRNA pseudouridine1911/1915/1917 synthase